MVPEAFVVINPSGRTGSYLQMNRLGLRDIWLKLKTARNLPTVLEESMEEYTPIQ
jgi:hypothetical protein